MGWPHRFMTYHKAVSLRLHLKSPIKFHPQYLKTLPSQIQPEQCHFLQVRGQCHLTGSYHNLLPSVPSIYHHCINNFHLCACFPNKLPAHIIYTFLYLISFDFLCGNDTYMPRLLNSFQVTNMLMSVSHY